MRYRFIENHRSEFRVLKMVEVFDVSRSGYYQWRKRPESIRAKANRALVSEIERVHEESRERYGSPRIYRELKSNGIACSENRVARLMRKLEIQAKTKRKFKATTNSGHKLPVAENLVRQNFTASKPDELWTSDITYVWTEEGWLYLAVVLDVCARRIVAWSTSHRNSQELVLKALKQALWQRNTKPGVIFHSDRGSQYAGERVKELITKHGFLQSMSNKGNCYDNAITESFFKTLKTELVYFEKYQTRQQAHSSLFEYIEIFYNKKRRHSAINYLAPVEYEKTLRAA
jgi:transposase InsO family protein